MTFSPRPLALAKIASVAFAIALLGLASSGCEDKHIGRVCDLDAVDGGAPTTGTSSTINGQAVECPTRICLLPANNTIPVPKTGPLCTAFCSSDDDCSDGETSSDPNGKQCKSGFSCLVATTVGNFCCQHVCVCRDFVDTNRPNYNALPEVCKPGQPGQLCKNVQ
jgi:hypothetical protein